ncbi:Gfo/Idh/MocA family protein [Actinomycetospora sp. TBRC 11914]|uniref:Gfo/Idh/MocA family protein n=1 Tax=Actinomycetospora sp. TBRC 11914 TaxID=2729387 RepID=UPI00145D04B6|nr:Gfo/Idh/MocA family oxidoreductase [Actinomycetospora sp. TBRC 11914]NMO91713.1 Gfo/Idh/MocA family oxidoreductase [Actinomycetospora sp. TBRC 11914]
MKIALIGEGAQGHTYAEAAAAVGDLEIVSVAGGSATDVTEFAERYGIADHGLSVEAAIEHPGVDTVIVGSPSALHVEHALAAVKRGKHVLVEIPMALDLAGAEELADAVDAAGVVGMVAHTRRYSPLFREVHRRVTAGELHLHQAIFHTLFFRRRNVNRFGVPRTWVDDLLWHQGCHTLDFFHWLHPDLRTVWAAAGPDHSELATTMDIAMVLQAGDGALVTGGLSFNNHGPIDVEVRFIGEEETLVLSQSSGVLRDSEGTEILRDDRSAFANQLTELRDAVDEGREPLTGVRACVPVMALLDRAQRSIDEHRIV